MEECLEYGWPGNIREMTSALDRILILNYDGCKKVQSLKECGIDIRRHNIKEKRRTQKLQENYKAESNQNDVEDIFDITSEKSRIISALKKAKYKRNKACKILDISYSTLWRKLKRYEIYESLR
jgi:transcriptional regulator with PAS, ATPase and Fis domain